MRSVVAVTALPLAGGRTLIAACDADGAVRLWDPAEAEPTARRLKRCPSVGAIAAVELPERTLLATGGADGTVRLWDPVTGEPAGDPLAGHAGQVNTIAVTRLPSGRTLLATGGSDGAVWLWDPAAGAAADDSLIGYCGPLVGYGGRIRAVAVVALPDGRTRLAFGGGYGVVELWDRDTRVAVIEPTAGGAPVNAIAAVELPDGRIRLATAVDYGTVRLWDPVTGESAGGPLVGHVGPVKAMATARLPDGHTVLATGGSDRTVLIWAFSDSS
jgi:WD40 repeat protein